MDDTEPAGVGAAVGVGVRIERDAATCEGGELLQAELRLSAGCQPEAMGDDLREDDGGLLRLDDADLCGGVGGQQVEAEETLGGLPRHGQQGLAIGAAQLGAHQEAYPLCALVLDAVAVVAIEHHLAVAHSLLLVDLPVDDRAVLHCAEVVEVGGNGGLLCGEDVVADEALYEGAVVRAAFAEVFVGKEGHGVRS